MTAEAALAVAAGAGVAALAALAGFLRLRFARGAIGPPALLQATALRFALTLAGALALALGWRQQAVPALAGLGATYLALLAVETRWSVGKVRGARPGSKTLGSETRGSKEE